MRKIFSMVPGLKWMVPVLFLSVFLLPLSARSEIKGGSVEVSPFAGYNFFESRQNLENMPVFGGRLGYNFTKYLGIEATGEYIKSHVDDKSKKFTREGQFTSPIDGVDITMYHLDLVYHFMPEGKFNPFLVAGYGAAHYNPKINTKNMSIIDFGLGAKYWVADHVALRLDVRDNMVLDDKIHNVEATAGIVFAFGGKSTTATTPVAQPVDSDGDGVPDTLDKCPGTPAGVAVDKDGCPLDSDRDGVPDYLDKCPGTPAGVAVDKDGCPLDSDRDGVPDYLDKCPGTPAGVAVDKDGCPLDSDRDGVPDYLDKCPGTPAGVKVDKDGCPPEVVVVPAHVKAAAAKRFCSKPAVLAINFDSDKSDIKPEYHDELKTVGDFLIYFPNAKGEISGHTDSTASNAHNQKLSERRAESVQKYISTKFKINPGRITTKGYGETKPIASNKTKAGRAENRRIVANFTCE
jgi:OOP family OmpA-OmpF porin